MNHTTRCAVFTITSVKAFCASGRLDMYGYTPPHHACATVMALVSIAPWSTRSGPAPLSHASQIKRGGFGSVVEDDSGTASPLPRYGNATTAGDGPPRRID